MAVVRIRSITGSGIGSGLKRRIERLVRRKACRSMGVKVGGLNFEDDPLLPFAVGPGLVVVPAREHVDVFIGALGSMGYDPALQAEIAIRVGWILDHEGHVGLGFHVAVFDATFIGVDENVVAVCIEPDWCDLRNAFGIYGGKK